MALLGALAMPVKAEAVPGITAVGTLERFPQEAIDAFGPDIVPQDFTDFYMEAVGGTVIPVLEAGQLWQVYPDESWTRTEVLVRDSRNLRVVRTFAVEAALARGSISPDGGGEWLHAVDPAGRVFLVTVMRELLEVDTTTFAVRSLGRLSVVPLDFGIPFDPLRPAGLAFDSATGGVLVLYGGPSSSSLANRLTVLQRIDPTTGAREHRHVRSCTGPLPATDIGGMYAAELLLLDDAVYVTCQAQVRGFFGPPTTEDDTRALVVRLPRETLWESDGGESSVDAGRRFNGALVDSAGGRIAVVDWGGRVTVVDVAAMNVVGVFNATATNNTLEHGIGLDRASGRFFFQSDYGFGYAELRSTPVPPVTVDASAAADGQERIYVDGNRVYVLPGSSFARSKPDHYTIYNVTR